jgi:hypothetical protein
VAPAAVASQLLFAWSAEIPPKSIPSTWLELRVVPLGPGTPSVLTAASAVVKGGNGPVGMLMPASESEAVPLDGPTATTGATPK